MENVTDRTSNPFGMAPPCEAPCSDGVPAVMGYGDANADFHLVGDHPGVHGGAETGVPFTGSEAGRRLQPVLQEVGFAAAAYADEPEFANLYASYLHPCCAVGGEPDPESYADLERFFDAELRAINAHVLLPVGRRATAHVLEGYTTLARKVDPAPGHLHASELRGRGFMVIPVDDPAAWTGDERDRLVGKLESVLASDYRQTKGVATRVG